MRYGVRDEYAPRFGRQVLTLWSGTFSDAYEGEAVELPKHNGYMIRTRGFLGYGAQSIRVECASPRTSENYQEVDAALNEALNAHDGKEG